MLLRFAISISVLPSPARLPTGSTFWTGTIREEQTASAPARVWNGDADYETW